MSINPAELDLKEENLIQINRVAKVVTGGRRFSFNSIVAIGDGHGHVGIGFGKANEVASAISKAKEDAKKNLFKVPVINGTIPHIIHAKAGASKVMLKPASPGTGIIASAPIRAVLVQAGYTDVLAKCTGSTNALNVVRATKRALGALKDAIEVARKRGMSVKELFN
ncbi:MAG: 30S ribosomal protein S5 [Candidatus Marinimicrobia bacterium]|nr:30S ribosomal protein S5 [Candidatus Neomarinimicrobiota bacterium]MCH7858132.1 30S ribosomal protein S5 [Candidatus Neomarinimicrobiota bacterium]